MWAKQDLVLSRAKSANLAPILDHFGRTRSGDHFGHTLLFNLKIEAVCLPTLAFFRLFSLFPSVLMLYT